MATKPTHEQMLEDAKARYARLTEKVSKGVMTWDNEGDRQILLQAEKDIDNLTRLVNTEKIAERRRKHTPRRFR